VGDGGGGEGEVEYRSRSGGRKRSVRCEKREGRARAKGRSKSEDRRIPGLCWGMARRVGSWLFVWRCDVVVVVGGAFGCWGGPIRISWGPGLMRT
jgi:hypothetical protein